MIQALLYGGYEYVIFLEELLATADDKESGYFVDVDSAYTDTIKITTRYFPLYPECQKNESFSLTL